MSTPAADKLCAMLESPGILSFPCCYDALSARLIERAGFVLSFMSGFAVSAVRLGLPDTGLISYGEMLDQGRNICARVSMPIIGDGDTGYGNPVNVKRTVRGGRTSPVCGSSDRAGFMRPTAIIAVEMKMMPREPIEAR